MTLGGFGDPLTHLRRQVGAPEEVIDDPPRLLAAERLQEDAERTLDRFRPGRARLEQVVARRADDQDGSVFGDPDGLLDELEERRFGPVDILEVDNQRPIDGHRLKEAPGGPERFVELVRGRREADCCGDALGRKRLLGEQRRHLGVCLVG